jgi:hypothetical protein
MEITIGSLLSVTRRIREELGLKEPSIPLHVSIGHGIQ